MVESGWEIVMNTIKKTYILNKVFNNAERNDFEGKLQEEKKTIQSDIKNF